jgi:hypothetical protein
MTQTAQYKQKFVYRTTYKQGGFTYSSHVWAESEADAKWMVKARRNIGEKLEECWGYKPLRDVSWSKLRNKRKGDAVTERLHYLTFLAFVALKAGYPPDDVMGDTGWFHEYIHRLHIKDEPLNVSKAALDATIMKVETHLGFAP